MTSRDLVAYRLIWLIAVLSVVLVLVQFANAAIYRNSETTDQRLIRLVTARVLVLESAREDQRVRNTYQDAFNKEVLDYVQRHQ